MLEASQTYDHCYLPGLTVAAFAHNIRVEHRWAHDLIDYDRLIAHAAGLATTRTEFDDNRTGRGDSYRAAQHDGDARAVGIGQLLDATTDADVVLDVLGGDGLIADHVRRHPRPTGRILTADLSGAMVAGAASRGLPAVRQAADAMVLSSASIDAVLMAYGTHHIDPRDRRPAFTEARRVLRPGGQLVVHDFDAQSNVAQWFHDVVDRHAPGGHRYTHFTPDGLGRDLTAAGFTHIDIRTLYDPIQIRRRAADEAELALAKYLTLMYGLTTAVHRRPRGYGWLLGLCSSIFQIPAGDMVPGARPELSVYSAGSDYIAELPRLALVATAVKDGP